MLPEVVHCLPCAHDKIPEEFVERTKPLVPSADGNLYATPLNVVVPVTRKVPETDRVATGVVVPIPTLLLAASITRVLVAKLRVVVPITIFVEVVMVVERGGYTVQFVSVGPHDGSNVSPGV